MRHIGLHIVLMTLSVLFFSCQKEENEIVRVEVEAVSLGRQELTLYIGDTCVLTANVVPVNATDKTIKWQSDRPDIATVNNGLVRAVKTGNAIITASAGGIQSQCRVTVLKSSAFLFGTMSTDASIINGAGGATSISVTADSAWALVTNENWLTVSPSSGQAGTHVITITTSRNSTGKDRNGVIALTPGSQSQKLAVCQRPNIYERRQVVSGNVSNAVKLTYSGTEWNYIYSILPYPKSNLYQDIKSVNINGATIYDCPDSVNSYIVTYLTGDDIPMSGNNTIVENISTVAYEVTAHLNLINNIPPYDQNSVECKKYLGKEDGDLVDPTNSSIVSVANNLWNDSNGNLIDYARRCYEWTAKNMSYGNMYTGLHTITELMRTKRGDCGNFSSVFISLLRSKGIPARHIVMISPQESGYHVRAEFYIPAYGWIPADPTFKNSNPSGDFFGKFTGKYIVMSLGINSIIKDPYGNDYIVPLLQNYYYWYWWHNEGSYMNFEHIFSKFN
ncbi:MAG: Ig-like domain-containing protein [Bacteroidaceae bacterium]|nr:Ig-like domain-containing protein [Bacteroidaceae bacterium]